LLLAWPEMAAHPRHIGCSVMGIIVTYALIDLLRYSVPRAAITGDHSTGKLFSDLGRMALKWPKRMSQQSVADNQEEPPKQAVIIDDRPFER
jgi:hypothetical protein